MDNFRKFLSLSWLDRWVLLRCMFALPLAACALRWFGLRRCRAFIERTLRKKTAAVQTISTVDEAQHVARLVRIAARRNLFPANCLQRSIVLWWLLRRRGIRSEIQFGCRAGDEGLEMHAWVECEGQVIGDRDDIRERFAPFAPNPNEVAIRTQQ